MFYEINVKVTRQLEDGKVKDVKEAYLVDKVELFAEAEQKGLELYDGQCDVVSIKRSNISEVVNEKKEDEDKDIFKATVSDVFTDDNGVEKENKYRMVLYAKDIDDAHKIMQEVLKQNYSMTLIGINKSNFLEII